VQQKPYPKIITQAGRLAPGIIPEEDELDSDPQCKSVISIVSYSTAFPTGYRSPSIVQEKHCCKHPVCTSHFRIRIRMMSPVRHGRHGLENCGYCRAEVEIQKAC